MSKAILTLLRPFQRPRMTLLALFVSGLAVNPVVADTHYDSLIIQARDGNTTPILDFLQKASSAGMLNSGQVADWLQIAGWAGHDNDVIAIYQRYQSSMQIPARGLAAVARAYRNQKRWDQALALWQASLKADPNNTELISAMIMTQADAGRDKEALQKATELVKRTPSAQSYLALSYLHSAANRHYAALEAATKAMDFTPVSPEVIKNHVAMLQKNRVAAPALKVAQENSKLFTPAQMRQLERDALAEKVRQASLPTRSEQQRFDLADQALEHYLALLIAWQNNPETQTDYQQARIDRLGAMLARAQMTRLINDYEAMQREGYTLPGYAQRWAASAYIDRRQPEKAAAILSDMYFKDGKTVAKNMGLEDIDATYYALLESEQLDKAQAFANAVSNQAPYQLFMYNLPVRTPNDEWLEGQFLLAQSEVNSDELPAAERRLTKLTGTAPVNMDLRIALAKVYATRGWPRRAERELKQVESLEPSSITLEAAQAETALELQEWRQFELLIDDLVARVPENVTTQELARQRQIRHMSELRISGGRTLASDSPLSGKNDQGIEALLYSPPIDENWRVFTGGSFDNSHFEEGRGINRVLRLGAEFTARNNWVEAEVANHNYGYGNKVGGRLSAWHDFNDHWRIGGSAEKLAKNTPLRALKNNVNSDSANLFVRWNGSDRQDAQLSVTPSHFSDGNHRWEYAFNGRQRVYTAPYLSVDLNLDLSSSQNTKEDTLYYNPKRDFSAVPSLTFDHIMYRRYKTVWSQQLQLGAGTYWEKNYGTGAVTSVGYGQRIQWNDVVDTGVSVTWDKRPYDGKRERDVQLSFDMNYRF
ncbi:biofilm formation protein HmsH [Yersinia entomophaga]|uniref:Biofilm formation protein HmsH n=1 Tax=Yersinia entomophaga TaxID=935293 RepID=A0ABM6BHY7_YERET|nr:poly-beta-1,6 N-acetyl-D-glucosamine export porin PgaA [Yersinia entomophaga]ANI29009.1 biofilm formation protein HmsH [Yersinia entomophaga]OWF88769.1 poly-beta-1,6 N-acetyl-D-glucosamine export porin PgaA [Yersinia entomophaga]